MSSLSNASSLAQTLFLTRTNSTPVAHGLHLRHAGHLRADDAFPLHLRHVGPQGLRQLLGAEPRRHGVGGGRQGFGVTRSRSLFH